MRVLVVDDSPQFAAAAVRFLSEISKLEVVGQARSGREAVEQVASLHPDVVLMDMVMPEMDGLEATRRIKRSSSPPQVIILTLHDGSEYRQQARLAGADGFISKTDFGTAILPLIHDLR